MLTFAASLPHPTISVPEIGKANTDKVSQTISAYARIKQELYASQPETVVIISAHTANVDDAFSINQQKELTLTLKKFGDLKERFKLKNNIALGYRIRESLESNTQMILTSDDELDYASAITLLHLLENNRNVEVVVVGAAPGLSSKEHFDFGQKIIKQIDNNSTRIALLATADLSHAKETTEPIPDFLKFDQKALAFIEKKNIKDLVSLDEEADNYQAGPGLKSIMVLLGALHSKNYQTELVSYENVVGIGYPSLLMHLN